MLSFLTYVNVLSENLNLTVKPFAEDTLMFDTIKKPQRSAEILDHDLTKTSEWAYLLRKRYFLITLQRQINQI